MIGGERLAPDAPDREELLALLAGARAAESELQRIRDAALDLIAALAADGTFRTVNRACKPILGYEPDELVGRGCLDLVHPHDRERTGQMLAAAASGEPVTGFQNRWLRKDGEMVWLEWSGLFLPAAGALYGIAREITARKQQERVLAEREQQYRSLFEYNSDVVAFLDLEDNLIRINPAGATLTGHPAAELLGKKYKQYLDPAEIERAAIRRAEVRQGHAQTYEITCRHLRGHHLYFAVTAVPVVVEGEITGMCCIAREITEQKLAEERAQQAAARAAALADLSQALAQAHLNAEAVLQTIVQRTGELLGDTCVIRLLSEDGQWLQAAACYHPDPAVLAALRELLATVPQRADEGLAGRIIVSGEPLLVPVVSPGQIGPQLKAEYRPLMERIGVHSILAAPLRAEGRIIGVLGLTRDRPGRPYTTEDLTFLQHLADRAALAIINARLFAQANRRLDYLQALRNIDMAITASLDPRVTLNVFLDQVVSQLRVDAADVLLLDPHTQWLEYAAGRGFRTRAVQRTKLRLGDGYAGRCARERRIMAIPNLGEPPVDFARAGLLEGEGFAAYYAAPLIAKGQVKGVMEIFHRAPLAPDQEWMEFLEALAGQAAIALDNATLLDDLNRSNIELALAYDTTLEGWARALELRDIETAGHTVRVTEATLRLARAMGVNDRELVHVRRGALLHDIGKMGIPDSILLKPGPLTHDEWAIMRRHPEYAFELLSPIPFLRPALDIPYCHHERWDGRGYPRGLRGEQIPLAARIFAVCDVWDALRSDRPYRPAWPEERVRQHLAAEAGKHFDPRVVEAFLQTEW